MLKRKYEDLLLAHSMLKTEFSENFMIESMNDMKSQYEQKEEEINYLNKKKRKIKKSKFSSD